MPRRKQPARLQTLALKSLGSFVTAVGRKMIDPICLITSKSTPEGMDVLQQSLDRLNELLYSTVPWYLYDKMVLEVLHAIALLIQETKSKVNNLDMSVFINHMNVVVNLTEVAVHPLLRRIDFSIWPKIMRHVLYKRLDRMTGLEVLNLGSGTGGWKTSDAEKAIVSSIKSMENLTTLCLCFDCTDHILAVVGENCKHLKCLDVTSSRSVTDRSIVPLLSCQNIKQLLLYRTSVTVEGYARLFLGLPNLEDLGRCDEFGSILEHLYSSGGQGPFGLRVFQSRDVTTGHINLLIKMCPNITHVSLYHDERISDLTVLGALEFLSELKLLNCDFYTDYVKQLLEIKGKTLTSLHLEHVDEIDLNALKYISQYCQNLKKLTFYNCEFIDQHTSITLRYLEIPPFRNLKRLKCVADCSLVHLEFLMSNCKSIKYIHVGSSTGISDALMTKVLTNNPMLLLEEFKILYSDHLSMQTVRSLYHNCKNLRVLCELENWQMITETELADFRDTLLNKNIDLNVRPNFTYSS